jgi:hypothetical protein
MMRNGDKIILFARMAADFIELSASKRSVLIKQHANF